MTITSRRTLRKDQLLELLRDHVDSHGSRAKWASAHGVPVRMVGMCLDGTRPVTTSIANALGYLEVTVYEPIGRTGMREKTA